MDKKTMDQMIKMNDTILDLRTIVPQLEAKLSSLESENRELREKLLDLELLAKFQLGVAIVISHAEFPDLEMIKKMTKEGSGDFVTQSLITELKSCQENKDDQNNAK